MHSAQDGWKLTEENRLYDMMEAQTARQIAMLRNLLDELQKTENPDRARHLLGQVIIIGTYIKRRSNLIFCRRAARCNQCAGASAVSQ